MLLEVLKNKLRAFKARAFKARAFNKVKLFLRFCANFSFGKNFAAERKEENFKNLSQHVIL